MESQDHKLKATPSGHESHDPHFCHKCGWPFPNPHPSARHRRAHKKVCGTIEGYKLSESEAADNSTHSAVSIDEHHSDGDQQTPSPKGEKTSIKHISSIGSYRSEDETFTDAVAEFSDSGISPGMEERMEGVKNWTTNVGKIDDELLKADSAGGISEYLNEAQNAKLNDPESIESAINQPEAAKSLGTKLDRLIGDSNSVKSEIPVDASLQEINATGFVEAQKMPMSSGQPNDLKGIEDINADEGLVDAVDTPLEAPQTMVSDTEGNMSTNDSYESKPREAEEKSSDPLSLPYEIPGADRNVSSPSVVADEQITDSVPIEADLQRKERVNPDSADLKLDLPEADIKASDVVNVDKAQEQLDKEEHDKQVPYTPTLELEADPSKELDGSSQTEVSDSSNTEEGREDMHVVSLAKDLPALDNPELLLNDFKDYNKFKTSFPLDLGSSEVICSVKDDTVAAPEVSRSFVDTGMPDGSISSVALDVPEDQVSEEKVVVSSEGEMDSSRLVSTSNTFECGVSTNQNSNSLTEHEDSSKNSLLSTPADNSDTDIRVSSIQEVPKQTTKVDDPVSERTETSFTMAEENNGGASESDNTVYPAGGNDAIVTDTFADESREHFHEASKDISSDAKALESASATGLGSNVISDCDVKEQPGLLVDTDLNSRTIDKSHAGDGLESAAGVISSASPNEDKDKLIKQNDTVSAVDISMASSRTDSLDANWGSVSVLSTQSESTAVPDAEATDAGGLEKLDRDSQKPNSGAKESQSDKSDVYEPPSFMTLVESGESADKKATASEIEAQQTTQQQKTEALKAGWFPSITNVVNDSQGRKKNEEIIAKVTNWSTGKQHTPLKNLLGEAKSPNAKQVPSVNNKDGTATKKNGSTVTTVNSILSSEAPTEQAAANKEVEKEWNSPARYPVDIKKEKRKTKPYWVPFVCCSSVHQDA